jgi:hypothetical protein
MPYVIVRVKSHRARYAMQSALGHLPQGYFSWEFDGEFREVTPDELHKLQGIKGITRAKVDRTKLRAYWNWA